MDMTETKHYGLSGIPRAKVGGGEQPFKYPLDTRSPSRIGAAARLQKCYCRGMGNSLWQRRHTVKNLKRTPGPFRSAAAAKPSGEHGARH